MFSSSASVPYWRLSSFYFFYFALVGAWMPFWPLYLQDSGFNPADIGYLAGILMATKIVAPNIWSWLADKTGQRMTIIRSGCLIALVIFLGLFWNLDSFWWMAIIVAGYSFFWNAVLAQFEVVTLSHLGTRYQRYGQIRVWGSIGFIIAVTLLGYSFDVISIVWLPWVVVFLLLGIWLSSLTVNEKHDWQTHQRERRSLKGVIKQPAVIAFFVACFLLQVSHGPYYTFFSVYLEDYGYSRTVTGLLWSLGVVAEVFVFIVMYKLLQRFSLRQIMFTSLIFSVIRWLLLGFYVDNWLIVVIAQILHAASFGSYHAFAVEMVRRFFNGGLEGQGMAMYSSLSFGAGGAVGAVLSGWVWEINPTITFVAAALACVLATIISYWVTE
ncbi:MAG: MFS transporter [Oceanicoccus sp.]|uniref:MFS transporter n=1 Tax=Oceanicoccus sp. TaxID=2691044 RepID=UPI002636AD23|nr:MFS transporter [Oceanicoccus sp.]MCP3906987.1 MFS transporter [Oceanicoccus sp.]